MNLVVRRRFPLDVFTRSPTFILSDVEDEAGGETAIPLAVPLDAVQQSTAAMSACARRGGSYFPGKGIAVRPEKVCVGCVRVGVWKGTEAVRGSKGWEGSTD